MRAPRVAPAWWQPLKLYRQKSASKELTSPQPVLQGPPPNLAMLNPVIDATYAANFGPGAAALGPSAAPAPVGHVDQL